MGTPPPDALKRLVDARDMTEMPDISDRAQAPPGPAEDEVRIVEGDAA